MAREKIIGIYLITINTDSPRSYYYVGQSQDCIRRRKQHLDTTKKGTHRNNKLQAIFNKYKNMQFDILEEFPIKDLNVAEKWFLNEIWGNKYCMNIALDTEVPARGLKRSKEQCLRQSELRSGENHPNFGKHLSEETKEAIRAPQLGISKSEETKIKMRKPKKEGFKEMRRIMATGVKQRPEDVEKRAAKLRGIPRTDEYKLRMKILLNSPEIKEKARITRALKKLEKEKELYGTES